jgi:hypothetical protein
MRPTAIPARITIDFRDTIHPSRTWILGLGEASVARVELLAFERAGATDGSATALTAECTCPDGCERDHANE